MCGGSAGPDEFAVAIALGEDAYEAGFAIEYSLYVCGGDTCVVPGGGNGEAHEVSGKVAHSVVESGYTGGGTAGGFVESGAVDAVGRGWSIGAVTWWVWAYVAKRVGGAEIG